MIGFLLRIFVLPMILTLGGLGFIAWVLDGPRKKGD